MRNLASWRAAVLGLACCWGAAVARGELPGPVVPAGLGVNIHFTDPQPGELEMLAAGRFPLGADGFRLGGDGAGKGQVRFPRLRAAAGGTRQAPAAGRVDPGLCQPAL